MGTLEMIQRGKQSAPPRMLIYGVEGIGKAQPLDAKVLTPGGFVTMRDICVGDEVIGSDGKPHRVIGVYPQGEKEVFRVTFRGGSTTECCDDHLWFTQTRGERDRGLSGAVRPLHDVRKTLRYGTHFNHGVPRVQPVEFAPAPDPLPLNPWLLGMYLGDGYCSGGVGISNPEQDIRVKIAEALPEDDVLSGGQSISVRIRRRKRSNQPTEFKATLSALGLAEAKSADKFIPPEYLHASVTERLELLRGLVDSDGFVTKPGAIEITTVSPRLADDLCFLIRSLGGSAKRVLKKPTYTYLGKKRKGKLAHRIFASFPNGGVPVSSDKHLGKWEVPRWAIRHTIREVESVGRKVCQCIRIDAPDSLYVTDDFILTHNSTVAAEAPAPIFIQTEDGLGQIDCHKFPLAESFEDIEAAIAALINEDHDYQTVVIDSLDWAERLIWERVCSDYGASAIEKVDGGYGRGFAYALAYHKRLLDGLSVLHSQKQMMVILLAHAKVERFEDPEATAYDRYSPRLNKHAGALIVEWADAVLFATRRMRVETETTGFNRERSIAHAIGKDGGERILRTVGGPSCIAKNRYSLPAELPLDWTALFDGITGNVSSTTK